MKAGSENKIASLVVAIIASAFWGLSGTAAQILFQDYSFPPLGLVTLRLFISSAILFLWFKPKWPSLHSREIILFGVLGILPSQLFYFLAIDYSNVAFATLVQLLFLPIVVIYEISTRVYRFTVPLFSAILLAMVGAAFLVLKGPSFALHATPLGILFGTLCAISAAYYTLASKQYGKLVGSWSLTSWGFLIAGLISLPIGVPTLIGAKFSLTIIALILFVAFFGTLLAYGLYMRSLQRLTATEVSVTATAEPIVAVIAGYFFIGVLLSALQYLGGALILISMVLLTKELRKPKRKELR